MDDKYAQWLKVADARLHPSITNPNYLVLRRRRLILDEWITGIPGDGLRVLDVGGRYQPYRPLLQRRLRSYVALDVSATPLVDVLGSGEQIPFKACTFDLVLATGVFEFFPQPRVAAAEVHRVLKPGGHLLLSVAGVCPRMNDNEQWRYLPLGLKSLLASFSKIEIVPEGTSLGGIVRLNAVALSCFAKYRIIRQILHHTIVPIMNLLGLGLEGAALSTNDQIAGNYSVLAQK